LIILLLCDGRRTGACQARRDVIPSEFSRRHSDAASSTRSLSRDRPTSPDIAGKPPAAGAATPGVLAKNVQDTREVSEDRRNESDAIAPSKQANQPAANSCSGLVPSRLVGRDGPRLLTSKRPPQ